MTEFWKGKRFLILKEEYSDARLYLEAFESLGAVGHAQSIKENSSIQSVNLENLDFLILQCHPQFSDLLRFVRTVNLSARDLPVFVLLKGKCEQCDETFFEGADCVFEDHHSYDVIVKSVKDALTDQIHLQSRKYPRKKTPRVRAYIDSAFGSILGYARNISKGGVFIGTSEGLPKVGDQVQLRLTFDGQMDSIVHGRAVVRWIREENSEGKPKGFGLEFTEIK